MTNRLTCAGDVKARRALQAGAEAYLKTALQKELLETIRGVYAGKKPCSSNLVGTCGARDGHRVDKSGNRSPVEF
jgi:hypothetical protein